MRNLRPAVNRRLINFGLLAALVIGAGVGVIAAVSGGHAASTGDARACGAFWAWYDQQSGDAPAPSDPVYTAYQEATTTSLGLYLRALSDGLKALAREAGQDQTPGQSLTDNAALAAERDCTNLGVANPLS